MDISLAGLMNQMGPRSTADWKNDETAYYARSGLKWVEPIRQLMLALPARLAALSISRRPSHFPRFA